MIKNQHVEEVQQRHQSLNMLEAQLQTTKLWGKKPSKWLALQKPEVWCFPSVFMFVLLTNKYYCCSEILRSHTLLLLLLSVESTGNTDLHLSSSLPLFPLSSEHPPALIHKWAKGTLTQHLRPDQEAGSCGAWAQGVVIPLSRNPFVII